MRGEPVQTSRVSAGGKFLGWSLVAAGFGWLAAPRIGLSFGVMFLLLGMIFLRAARRRQRASRPDPFPVPHDNHSAGSQR